MQELENLGLTEKDFELIVKGLDSLPNSSLAGEMVGELMLTMLTADNPEAREQMESKQRIKALAKEREREMIIEDIRILQGKLLLFKRILKEKALLKEANNIISK